MATVRTAGSLRMGPRTLRATLSLLVGYEEGSDVDLMIGHFLEDHAAALNHFNEALMPVLALNPDGSVSDDWKTPAAVASMSAEDIASLVPALHVALYIIPNVKEKDSTSVRLQSFLSGIKEHFRYLKGKLTDWDFNSYIVEAPELPARDDANYVATKRAFDYITSVSHPSKFIDGALKIALELRANRDARSKEVTKDGKDNKAKDKSRSLVKLFGQPGQGLLAKLPEDVNEDARFVTPLQLIGKCANATGYDLKETCPDVLNRDKWTIGVVASPYLAMGYILYECILKGVDSPKNLPDHGVSMKRDLVEALGDLYTIKSNGLLGPLEQSYMGNDVFRFAAKSHKSAFDAQLDWIYEMCNRGADEMSGTERLNGYYGTLASLVHLYDHGNVLSFGRSTNAEQRTKDDDPTRRAQSSLPLDVRHWCRGAHETNIPSTRKRNRSSKDKNKTPGGDSGSEKSD